MKAHYIILLASVLGSWQALALPVGHYTGRCDSLVAARGYTNNVKGPIETTKSYTLTDITVTQDGEYFLSKLKGVMYSADGSTHSYESDSKYKVEVIHNLERDIHVYSSDAGLPPYTTTDEYRIEVDGSRTWLRSIDGKGNVTTPEGGYYTDFISSDGTEVKVASDGVSWISISKNQSTEIISSKMICMTKPDSKN